MSENLAAPFVGEPIRLWIGLREKLSLFFYTFSYIYGNPFWRVGFESSGKRSLWDIGAFHQEIHLTFLFGYVILFILGIHSE